MLRCCVAVMLRQETMYQRTSVIIQPWRTDSMQRA